MIDRPGDDRQKPVIRQTQTAAPSEAMVPNTDDRSGLPTVHGEVLPTPPNVLAYSWMTPISTRRRESAFEGILMGCGVAEALATNRDGRSRRHGLRIFGRTPKISWLPGSNRTSHNTHALLITAQAILECRCTHEQFTKRLRKRFAWYRRSFPLHYLFRRLQGKSIRRGSISIGFGDNPLPRAIMLAIGLQGATPNVPKWVQKSSEISHRSPKVYDAAKLVAEAAQIAQLTSLDKFDPQVALASLIQMCELEQLRTMLESLQPLLAKRRSIASVAKSFGWKRGIPSNAMAISVISIYAWLRHGRQYERCVGRSVLLGGACGSVAAVAGALSAVQTGTKNIPSHWKNRLTNYPYDSKWMDHLIERMKDWPHGVEDIQNVKGLPTLIGGQLTRNAGMALSRCVRFFLLLPCNFLRIYNGR
jgi:ADP-ribosylglycohydrolase